MKLIILPSVVILFVLFTVRNLSAHCDGIDGPVVKSEQKSLEENNVNYIHFAEKVSELSRSKYSHNLHYAGIFI